jgi:hypothetical protein
LASGDVCFFRFDFFMLNHEVGKEAAFVLKLMPPVTWLIEFMQKLVLSVRNSPSLLVVGLTIGLLGCSSAGYIAVQSNDAERLKEVLKSPNRSGENLRVLLEETAESGCDKCAEMLFKAGEKPETSAYSLGKAAVRGHAKVVRVFLENGVDSDEGIAAIRDYTETGAFSGGIYEPAAAQAGIELINRITQSTRQQPTASAGTERSSDGFSNKQLMAPPSAMPRLSDLIPHFREPERPNDFALIIGIEKYDDLPAALYAERDAATAADFVRALGVPARNVVTLTGSHATRSSMVKQLENWLAKNTDDSSTVYFYFSGHGAPDPATGQAYLVPFDGDPQYLAETAYPLKRLYEKLHSLKSKRTIVMIDSCFSGAGGRSVLTKGARPLVNNVDIGLSGIDGKTAVLTASGANQISGTNDEYRHGLFTYYLLTGLNGAAVDGSGRVTLESLYGYLKPKVMDDARRANGDQTPELRVDSTFSSMVLRGK